MELETTYTRKKAFFKKIGGKPAAIVAICLILIAAAVFALVTKLNASYAKQSVEQRTAKAMKGNISITVTGSGSVVSSNKSEISSSVTGKITKVYFKEGDSVKAGDLLFELDDSDARLNIEKIKNSIAQTRLTEKGNLESLDSLIIRAPFDGQVANIIPRVGDDVAKGTNVLTITDFSKLKLAVAFSGAVINDVYPGQKVTVNIQDLMQSVDGTVSYVSRSPSATSSGGAIYDVEVILHNPGSLREGMDANVEIQIKGSSQMSVESGKLEYANYQAIKSESNGTVKSINVNENQFVRAGDPLIELENDDLIVSMETTDLKLQDLDSQLEAAEKQLEDYKIYSPIDGIIVSQNVKEGSNVKPADILATILDPVHMEFSVPIDELDIAKIQTGQKVNITVDALPETSSKPLSGTVSKIALEGNPSNGVTTYPVTIQINEASNLRVGMNANAEIMISEKNDALLVPLEAVQKFGERSFVFVKGETQNADNSKNTSRQRSFGQKGDSSASQADSNKGMAGNFSRRMPGGANSTYAKYYENAVMKPVELGINNDQYIEILSGLQEGDEVILPPLASGSEQNSVQMRSGFGGMGGAFGGFGGAPGGIRSNNSSRIRN